MGLIVSGHIVINQGNCSYMKIEHNVLSIVGQNIRMIRKSKGLSQEKLALDAGLDRSYVGGIERGERNTTVLNLFKLAQALNVSPELFFKNTSSLFERE